MIDREPEPAASTLFCLTCRTVLARGQRCDEDSDHQVRDIGSEPGRSDALAAAWRRVKPEPLLATQTIVLISVLAAVPAAFFGVTLVPADTPWQAADELHLTYFCFAGALAFTAVLLVGQAISKWPRAVRIEPAGSYVGLGLSREGLVGTVALVDGDDGAPGDDHRPVANQVELCLDGDSAVTLRDGRSETFEVHLDDGRVLEVPAGPVRLDAPRARWERIGDGEARLAAAKHGGIDNPHDVGRPEVDPFPFESAFHIEIRLGDRLQVVGQTEAIMEDVDAEGSYRSAPGRRLRPRGVPRLRLLRRGAP